MLGSDNGKNLCPSVQGSTQKGQDTEEHFMLGVSPKQNLYQISLLGIHSSSLTPGIIPAETGYTDPNPRSHSVMLRWLLSFNQVPLCKKKQNLKKERKNVF